jgi:uncharacterized protein YqgC (DUF456 family)
MRHRPLPVTILSWVFILAGAIGFAFHSADLKLQPPLHYLLLVILLIRALAVVFGVYMLRGSNWARWGTILWLGLHVIISAFHSLRQFGVHLLLLAAFTYLLFTSSASAYFAKAEAPAT